MNRLATYVPSKWTIASIEADDALILPHRANPAGSNFREPQGNWSERVGSTSGKVWAAARELVEKQSLYDAFIIGGGDGAILRAAYGCPEAMIRLNDMNKRQSDHYLAWAAALHDAVQAGVGFVEGNLAHLWHGDVKHRRYHERWSEFRRFQFDPFEDIALHHNGAWRWNTDKRKMHDHVRDYLASRREDG